jgi:hypothetical protein
MRTGESQGNNMETGTANVPRMVIGATKIPETTLAGNA